MFMPPEYEAPANPDDPYVFPEHLQTSVSILNASGIQIESYRDDGVAYMKMMEYDPEDTSKRRIRVWAFLPTEEDPEYHRWTLTKNYVLTI